MAVVYAGTFLIFGVFQPFFPVWLKEKGLDDDWVGLILAAQIALRILVTGPVLRRADRTANRAGTLIVLACAAGLASLLFGAVDGPVAILVATLIFCALWAPLVPLGDAIALTGVRRLRIDFGRARLWGSLAFILANVGAGILFGFAGAGWFPMVLSVAFIVSVLLTLTVPKDLGAPGGATNLEPPVLPPPGAVVGWRRLRPAPDLAPLAPLFLTVSLIQGSHAMLNGFASIHWVSLGYSEAEIGILWAVGVAAEIVLFRFAAAPMRRLGVRGILALAGSVAVARWLLFTVDTGYASVLVFQLAHGLTFAATLVALQSVIADGVPEGRYGAAQGFAFVLQTVTTAVATLAGGFLFSQAGAGGFAAMALMAALALVILLVVPQPQRAAAGGNSVEPS